MTWAFAEGAGEPGEQLPHPLWPRAEPPNPQPRRPYLILQLGQEERQQVLDGVVFAQDWREAHDDGGQCRLDMLVGVGHQLLGGRRKTGATGSVAAETPLPRSPETLLAFVLSSQAGCPRGTGAPYVFGVPGVQRPLPPGTSAPNSKLCG